MVHTVFLLGTQGLQTVQTTEVKQLHMLVYYNKGIIGEIVQSQRAIFGITEVHKEVSQTNGKAETGFEWLNYNLLDVQWCTVLCEECDGAGSAKWSVWCFLHTVASQLHRSNERLQEHMIKKTPSLSYNYPQLSEVFMKRI